MLMLYSETTKTAIFRNSFSPTDNRRLEQRRRRHSLRWDSWEI